MSVFCLGDRDPPESYPINPVIKYLIVVDEFSYAVGQIVPPPPG